MGAPSEGQQQVDRQQPVAQAASGGDLRAQVTGSQDADRPQAAGRGDRRRELVTRQTAAHAGLNDRQLHPESLQEGTHEISSNPRSVREPRRTARGLRMRPPPRPG
jgi:hypothetical protein